MKRTWTGRLLDLLFPPKCPFCGRVLNEPGVCPKCEKTLPWIEEHLCERKVGQSRCAAPLWYEGAVRQALLRLKGEYPVRLVACIPCADQSERFSAAQRARYDALLSACDERVVLHERYENGCMFERNRYMVDRADLLLAYYTGRRGGTKYTVGYAERRGIPVYLI